MLRLPATDSSLVIRTDHSNQAAWEELCKLIETANSDGFRAYVTYWEDPALTGVDLARLIDIVRSGPYRSFFFVVDSETFAHPEWPVLVVDLNEQPGRTFRVVPGELWSVENNLSLANMDWEEFADNTARDGIFRGFART